MSTEAGHSTAAIFLAEAASIAMLDGHELTFEALAGRGAQDLVGARIGADQGIAGAVVMSGEPVVVDDLSRDARFARDVVEETGSAPGAIMVAPLLRDERTLGVLSVLDRGQTGRSSLQELELLVVLADQAARAVELTEAARRSLHLLETDGEA